MRARASCGGSRSVVRTAHAVVAARERPLASLRWHPAGLGAGNSYQHAARDAAGPRAERNRRAGNTAAAQTITDIKEARVSASTVHVEPNPKGRWIVRREDEREPLSEHESATEAKRVACELARLEGTSLVLLRDRYARIHHLHGEVRPERNQASRRHERAAHPQPGRAGLRPEGCVGPRLRRSRGSAGALVAVC